MLGPCKFIEPLVKIDTLFVHPCATSITNKVHPQAIYPRLYMSNIIKQTKRKKSLSWINADWVHNHADVD